MTPTIGRIVHYNSCPTPTAAIICAASPDQEGVVDLMLFVPIGALYRAGVGFSETPQYGCWSWPPKVEAPAPVADSSEAVPPAA